MKILAQIKKFAAFIAMLLLGGCVRIPQGVAPVSDFDINRYLGLWYEIARLDHSFERGLTNVTAEYSLGEGDAVKVINRGYDPIKQQWKEAVGKAYFVESPAVGKLKVSFFGPFYGGYNIIELDQEDYAYALVCGPSLNYLWILSRTPTLDNSIVEQLVARADSLGFDTDGLIYVSHDKKEETQAEK